MKLFEVSLNNNKPYEGKVMDYSQVTYKMDGKEITFDTDQLKKALEDAFYDDTHVSMILEAIHHHDGAIHSLIKI